jgi:single-stranded DNA-binding protein
MSITALVTGRLIATPERRTGNSGKPFTLAKLSAAAEGEDALVSLIAFGSVAEELAALGKGDTVAVNGRAKVNTWTGKDGSPQAGLSVTADTILSAYHLKKRRAGVAGDGEPGNSDAPLPQSGQKVRTPPVRALVRSGSDRPEDFGPQDWPEGER